MLLVTTNKFVWGSVKEIPIKKYTIRQGARRCAPTSTVSHQLCGFVPDVAMLRLYEVIPIAAIASLTMTYDGSGDSLDINPQPPIP